MQSCSDYLDSDYVFKNRETIERVFTDRDKTEQWLATAFSYLSNDCADVCNKRQTPHCFADDMYYGDDDGSIQTSKEGELSYKEGLYDENTKQAVWTRCYRGIRQASLFLQYVDMNDQLRESGELADYKAQARFVRAYYYWLLLRRYGPVPLLPDEGLDYDASYDDLATPRASYEEVANYIASEMAFASYLRCRFGYSCLRADFRCQSVGQRKQHRVRTVAGRRPGQPPALHYLQRREMGACRRCSQGCDELERVQALYHRHSDDRYPCRASYDSSARASGIQPSAIPGRMGGNRPIRVVPFSFQRNAESDRQPRADIQPRAQYRRAEHPRHGGSPAAADRAGMEHQRTDPETD